LRTAVVPVAPERGALLLALASLFGAGAIAEWSARRLDATLGAMGPSLVMFVTIAALGDGSWVAITILYTLAGALYLLALHHDEVRERRSWFHATEPRRSNTLVGGVIAAAAIVAGAAIIGPGVPGARSEPWIDRRFATPGNHPEANLLDRLVQPLGRERLQQIVDGVHFESTQGILIERRDEHDRRHPVADLAHDVEPIELRHLHVEKHQIRPVRDDRFDGGPAVPSLGNDIQLGLAPQHSTHPAARHRLIVHDRHSECHAASRRR
jgi:hypothetical protein